jgi:hypothetical protein
MAVATVYSGADPLEGCQPEFRTEIELTIETGDRAARPASMLRPQGVKYARHGLSSPIRRIRVGLHIELLTLPEGHQEQGGPPA